MILIGKTEEVGEKPATVPFYPPQTPHGLTQARNRASAATNRQSHGTAKRQFTLLFTWQSAILTVTQLKVSSRIY
jgi:hypothetical protein